MSIDWEVFDKIIYINLKERHDRKQSIEKELHSLGVPGQKIYRLDARRHLLGEIGRAQSHLQAMETAIIENWGHVLILEDDMAFQKDADSLERLNGFLKTLQSVNWHCALLSARYRKVITLKSTNRIVKPLDALSTCAYAVHADYRAMLRECFAAAVERLRKGGEEDQHAIDIAWLPLMQNHSWIGMYPVAGHQTPGRSDIKGDVVDYTEHFYKELAAIAQ